MTSRRRLRQLRFAALAATMCLLTLPIAAAAAAPHHPKHHPGPKPTIVLVHGAWADASSWNPVMQRLQHDGYTVFAPPNPLRGPSYDAATLTAFVKTIPGPVVLVGHSYGGFVITNAATQLPQVKALVYDDAYQPAKGETAFEINAAKPGSCVVAADPTTFLTLVPYPNAPAGDADAYLKIPASASFIGFNRCFANGVDPRTAALLAAGQRPFAVSAGSEPSGTPAWASIPSWSVIGTDDRVIPPAELLAMAHRAHSRITTVPAGHLSLLTAAGTLTRVVEDAARTVR